MAVQPVDISFPQSWTEFVHMLELRAPEVLYQDVFGYRTVYRLAPGVILKYGGDFGDEVLCMKTAQAAGLPVPDVIYHPGLADVRVPSSVVAPRNVWYFCMEEISGVPLSSVIDQLSDDKLSALASQLRRFLDILSCVKHHNTIGSVDGGAFQTLMVPPSYQPQHPFHSVTEFNHFLGSLYALCTVLPARVAEDISRLPTTDSIRFTHGDLVPKNIMVDAEGDRITGIIDWGNSGFYPSYWEYCRMHDVYSRTPGWERILGMVFAEPRRQEEIDAVHAILTAISDQL